MSYLTISYNQLQKKKEINIISLQQIVGEHIVLNSSEQIRTKFLRIAENRPDKFQIIQEKIFNVLSPNRTNITFSGGGTSPWTLVIGTKGVRKKLHLLLIGNRIWGVELDAGMRMKREATRLGSERLINFLKSQIDSMMNNPDGWDTIEVYLRT